MDKRTYSRMTDTDLSMAVNLAKSETSGVFKIEDLRKAFQVLKVPMYNEFATTLSKQGLFLPVGATRTYGYEWVSNEPLHKNKIAELMALTRKTVAARAKEYNHKKKAIASGVWKEPVKSPITVQIEEEIVPVQEHKELVPVDKAISRAVKLLLDHGYRVTRPVLIYEEITIKSIEV